MCAASSSLSGSLPRARRGHGHPRGRFHWPALAHGYRRCDSETQWGWWWVLTLLKLLLDMQLRRFASKEAIYNRNKEQRGKRRHAQSPDDRPAQRRVLLAAFAETQTHRKHSDDHR